MELSNSHLIAIFLLFWFQVPVDDSYSVKVVEGKSQLGQVELYVLLREHDLKCAFQNET
jgi:hypothetical protein